MTRTGARNVHLKGVWKADRRTAFSEFLTPQLKRQTFNLYPRQGAVILLLATYCWSCNIPITLYAFDLFLRTCEVITTHKSKILQFSFGMDFNPISKLRLFHLEYALFVDSYAAKKGGIMIDAVGGTIGKPSANVMISLRFPASIPKSVTAKYCSQLK